MFLLMGKLLIFSMCLEKSKRKGIRLFGKCLGALAVRYSDWKEKRLLSGKWDPVKRYRKRNKRKFLRNKKG